MLVPQTPIQTTNQVISVKGKVFYNDRKRRIDVKKPIRDLFEQSSMDVYYTMELCLSHSKAAERLKELSDQKIMPILMYFNTGGQK